MSQSPSTAHKYEKAIYEGFGVNGPTALMSLCSAPDGSLVPETPTGPPVKESLFAVTTICG